MGLHYIYLRLGYKGKSMRMEMFLAQTSALSPTPTNSLKHQNEVEIALLKLVIFSLHFQQYNLRVIQRPPTRWDGM